MGRKHGPSHPSGPPRRWYLLREALAEFLAVPGAVVIGMLILAAGTFALDYVDIGWLGSVHRFLAAHLFGNPQSTRSLFGTIAGSVITATSITFSVLLLAVSQSAASLSPQVYDQFLRRRFNQASFGFFVGVAVYALLALITVNPPHNPLYSATVVLLLTVFALCLLVVLLYSAVNQMRPLVIIGAIHDETLAARSRQRALIRGTRRSPRVDGKLTTLVIAPKHGFMVGIDIRALTAAAERAQKEVEVILRVPIGAYVAFQDPIAEIRAQTAEDSAMMLRAAQVAVQLEPSRDVESDPALGLEQLRSIGWSSISSSKQDVAPGLLTIRMMRDLLAHWCTEEDGSPDATAAPIVLTDDVPATLLDAFESLAVIAAEGRQYPAFVEVARTFTIMFGRLRPEQQQLAEALILRILATLGDHVQTAQLDRALGELCGALTAAGRLHAAAAVAQARARLAMTPGRACSERAGARG